MLRAEGWAVNVKRVERIWRLEGLKAPGKQPKKGRLWLNDGSCLRLRPENPSHVCTSRLRRGPHPQWQEAAHAAAVIDEFTQPGPWRSASIGR